MYFNRYQQGDEVQYAGTKESMKGLHGQLGVVLARVGGSDSEVVVAFDRDAYILDEQSELAKFVKRPERTAQQTESKGGPEVQKRRGVGEKPAGGGGRGGKRRDQNAS